MARNDAGWSEEVSMLYVDVSGVRIPALAFGTWKMQDRVCRDAVAEALAVGYRHVDTAQMYGNETEVGAAIRASGLPRDAVYVTTKLAPGRLRPERVHESARESVKRLGLGDVDLLLVHWPDPDVPLAETLGAMMELQEQGLVRDIGVSNFPPKLVERALALAPIVCNQVEHHPYLGQDALESIALDSNTMLSSYAPLAQGLVAKDETLADIGHRHRKTAAQVALRWLIQRRNVAAIPKACDPAHIVENFDVFDFELTQEEMLRVHLLDRGQRLVDPEWAPDWDAQPTEEESMRRRRKLAPDAPESIRSEQAPHPWIPDA